jgi:hypothetical protein
MRYSFEVTGENTEALLSELNRILDEERLGLQDVRAVSMDGLSRVVFGVDCVRPEHEALALSLHQSTVFSSVNSLGGTEQE